MTRKDAAAALGGSRTSVRKFVLKGLLHATPDEDGVNLFDPLEVEGLRTLRAAKKPTTRTPAAPAAALPTPARAEVVELPVILRDQDALLAE